MIFGNKFVSAMSKKLDPEKVKKALKLFQEKYELFNQYDDLCSFDENFDYIKHEFQIKRATILGLGEVCKGNLGITRDKMPQIINAEISLSTEDSKEKLKKVIKALNEKKKKLKLSDIETEKDKYEDIRSIDKAALMALINFVKKKGIDNLDAILEELKGKTILQVVEEQMYPGITIEKTPEEIEFTELKPTQTEIFSRKSLGIALFILHNTLFGIEVDNSMPDDQVLDKLLGNLDSIYQKFIFKIESKTDTGFPILSALNIYDFIKSLKNNINEFTEELLVDKEGYIIDGHHRWSACKFLKFVLNRCFDGNLFPDKVKITKKNVFFKDYKEEELKHPLVYSLNLQDELNTTPLNGGRRLKKSKRSRRKRSKRSRKLKKRRSKKKLL